MTQNQVDRILKAIKNAGVRAVCEACSNGEFHIAPDFFTASHVYSTPTSAKDGSVTVKVGPVTPMVAVYCARCGNTRWHMLSALGIVDVLLDAGEGK